MMRSCAHNEVVGLANRYMRDVPSKPTYDRAIVEQCIDELAVILEKANGGPFVPLTIAEFIQGREGYSKRRYLRAADHMARHGVDVYRGSGIKAFVKREFYSERKAPRMIMGRDPIFNILYGRFTVPLEHAMMRVPEFSKGKDFFQRGEQLEPYMHETILENDYSKFEASQTIPVLRQIELGLLKRLFKMFHKIVTTLFNVKMVKRGRTTNGVKFCLVGCRGSGDIDTGLFNTLVNWVAMRYFEIVNKFPSRRFALDGDDSWSAIPRGAPYINTYPQFCFDAKLKLKNHWSDVEYCSAKFVEYRPGRLVLMPNVRKLLNNIGHCKNELFTNCLGHYYYSLGYMYSICFPGFPIFTELSKFLMGITSNPKVRVSKQILDLTNYKFSEAFSLGSPNRVIDYDLTLMNTLLAYDIGHEEYSSIISYFATEKPVILVDKIFRKRGGGCKITVNYDIIEAEANKHLETNVTRSGQYLLTKSMQTINSKILFTRRGSHY